MVINSNAFLVFVLACSLSACAPTAIDSFEEVAVPTDFKVTLDRSFCFGYCPSYSVSIGASGNVEYCGEGFVEALGEHRKTISVQAVAELVTLLEDADFFNLRKEYVGGVSDQPTFHLTVQMNGKSKTVLNYAGELDHMPSVVTKIEEAIDQTAETSTWIGDGGDYDHDIARPICSNRPMTKM